MATSYRHNVSSFILKQSKNKKVQNRGKITRPYIIRPQCFCRCCLETWNGLCSVNIRPTNTILSTRFVLAFCFLFYFLSFVFEQCMFKRPMENPNQIDLFPFIWSRAEQHTHTSTFIFDIKSKKSLVFLRENSVLYNWQTNILDLVINKKSNRA